MKTDWQSEFISRHFEELCVNIGARPVGSQKNQEAAAYVGKVFEESGYAVEYQNFDCIDWKKENISLRIGRQEIEAAISDYSLPCDLTAPYRMVDTLDTLERVELKGTIAVLHDRLTKESIMPKNFRFYNPEEHQKIVHLLEEKQPVAIITVSFSEERPVPIIEDGDFMVPCAVVSKLKEQDFLRDPSALISLNMNCERHPSSGANVIVRLKGTNSQGKTILMSHLDTKPDTPGAIDNATGIIIQFLLAQQLKQAPCQHDLELVVFNGEDHFSAAGELAYLEEFGDFSDIRLAINCDGVGYKNAKTGVAYMGCSEQQIATFEAARTRYLSIEQMEPWYQSDHSIFFYQQVPTLALTTLALDGVFDKITHTPQDTPEIVESHQLLEVTGFLCNIL